MSRGYTVVWSGWQGDTAAVGGRLAFSPPIVPQVTGLPAKNLFSTTWKILRSQR